MTLPRWYVPLAEIMAEIAKLSADVRFTVPIRHGTMSVEVYAPLGEDKQTPHSQDELYIVINGRAEFVKNGERIAVAPQDLLFVEAGAEHRFEALSEDFATWVVFWGPEGGEA
jgi:mannose-6-phosphate isomerase-like protein (cupin superfamily)